MAPYSVSPYLAVYLWESITTGGTFKMSRTTPASSRPAPQPLKCLSDKRSSCLSLLIQRSPWHRHSLTRPGKKKRDRGRETQTAALALRKVWPWDVKRLLRGGEQKHRHCGPVRWKRSEKRGWNGSKCSPCRLRLLLFTHQLSAAQRAL